MRLEGRIALVTGGAGGIGAATCRRLAAEGARVAVTDTNAERAGEVAAEVNGMSRELDVRSGESIAAAVKATEDELGPIDTPLLMSAPEALGPVGERLVEVMIGSTVLRRLGQPDEVASAIVFLASDDASYVTGQALGVSGGLAMI